MIKNKKKGKQNQEKSGELSKPSIISKTRNLWNPWPGLIQPKNLSLNKLILKDEIAKKILIKKKLFKSIKVITLFKKKILE